MLSILRKTGLDIIGDVPWATHFCQFYQTPEDLLDTLVPYFKSGLEHNEFGMWVISKPLTPERARTAMRLAMPDFDRYLASGQIEILPHTQWYMKDGHFDLNRVLNGWVEKYEKAVAKGYDGIRVTGNTAWLEEQDWGGFREYEAAINSVIGKYRMLALCTYNLDMCSAHEIIDVMQNHQFALIKQRGKWQLVENSSYKAERKQAEEKLRETRDYLENLINYANAPIIVWDSEFCITRFNHAFERLTGLSESSVLGQHLDILFPGESRADSMDKIHRTLTGERWEVVEIPIQRTDGEVRTVLWNSANVFAADGKTIVATMAQGQDVTEIKNAELILLMAKEDLEARVGERTRELVKTNKQLAREIHQREKVEKVVKESEARLLEAQRIAHLGNWNWNIETNELLWSDEVYQIFGLKPRQFKATYDAFLERIHPDDRDRVAKSVDESLKGGRAYSINHRILIPDGSTRTVHEIGKVEFKKGKPVKMVGIVHDITEHTLAEDRLRVLSHKLLQIQEEERRVIARDIHDQIGQSITLLSFTLNKARKSRDNIDASLAETEAAIHDLAKQVREISHNLRPGILDDLGLVPALSWEFQHYTQKTNIRVLFEHDDLPGDLPPELNITAFRIIQEALTNVVRHAGVNEVIVRVFFRDSVLQVEVEDQGIGFNPEIVKKSSFGLVGMRERAYLAGGDLKLESAPGKGTHIILRFPVDPDTAR